MNVSQHCGSHESPSRADLISDLVQQIDRTEFEVMHRRKKTGDRGRGWVDRLASYSWGGDTAGGLCQHLIWVHKLFAEVRRGNRQEELAREILEWGKVTLGNLDKLPRVLGSVIRSAQMGVRDSCAPMNSGWTKIAAVFAQGVPNAPPQVIWDSRVSLSVCTRLGDGARGKLNKKGLQALFSNKLGWVGGRGGTRLDLQRKAVEWFPCKYGKWEAHFEGGRVVKEIAECLNSSLKIYGLPREALEENQVREILDHAGCKDALDQWTPWLVACVLFMDGY
jgi:hypothetical protein